MWGAIIGDLAGSIYEYEQSRQVSRIDVKNLLCENSFYSDDTILTIAVLDAVLNNRDYELYLKKYADEYANYKPNYSPYFKTIFSPGFIKWSKSSLIGTSIGNGAMMRISPVGYLFDSEEDIINNVKKATIPSHNSKEAIECANLVAMIIYLGRIGYKKEEIISKLNLKFDYVPFAKFNTTCYDTINNCLYALFNSNTFEGALREVISYGGDTDTNACIVGSMAEVLYGIPDNLIETARKKIPNKFVKKLDIGYTKIKKY